VVAIVKKGISWGAFARVVSSAVALPWRIAEKAPNWEPEYVRLD
jgi:hypothetical protein